MGCDIHAHVEVKLGGVWHHLAQTDFNRNYEMFSLMAGVRNYGGIPPLAEPRGLPEDVTLVTKLASDRYGMDGHSHSWLSYDEMMQVAERHRNAIKPWWSTEYAPPFGAWLFGNHITDWKEYPDDYPEELQDIRLVFWFDN